MRYLKKQGGFTFLEVVAAATFVSIAFVSVVQVFITVNRINRHARNLTDAKQLAQEKVEIYRNTAYSDIPIGSPAVTFTSELPARLPSPRSGVINVSEVEPGLKRIDVNILYTDRTAKNVQLTTYVTEDGINR